MGTVTDIGTDLRPPVKKNEIEVFFHCANCGKRHPDKHQDIECGWTQAGFQVWCRRCHLNIIHMDFQGQKHPLK